MNEMDLTAGRKWIPALGVFAAVLVLWEISVRLFHVPLYILPGPWEIAGALASERQELLYHSSITLAETLAGFSLAVALGMALALLMDRFNLFGSIIYPPMVVTQTVPVIVLAPLLMIYMGFGVAPKILMVVIMCFFPVAISFADGLRKVPGDQVNLVRLFGAREHQVYTLVKIPAAAPQLFSGMKVAATYSVTGAVVGEWLASRAGLGYYMMRVKNGFMLDKVFACVVVIIVLSLGMNLMVKIIQYFAQPHLRAAR